MNSLEIRCTSEAKKNVENLKQQFLMYLTYISAKLAS
jgi:hypothetical protein